MSKSLREWRDRVFGKKIDLDNGSYDCVDVSKSWAEYIVGKPWTESLSWGNAKDLFDFNSGVYWHKLGRGTAPKPGDIIVMNGNVGGGYGHTGVVIRVDGNDVIIYEQNTFEQHPIREARWSWNASYVRGLLRPKAAFTVERPTVKPVLQPYQRIVGNDGAHWRDNAERSSKSREVFKPGEVIDFKGFVRGENVEGNNVWFVGRYNGGYSWSGAYTNRGTSGLEDLTPKGLKPHERQVGNDVMNVRSSPQLVPGNVKGQINPGQIIPMKGYVRGQHVDGSDIWFVSSSGNYVHSDGFTNKKTTGLSDLTPKAPVDPPVEKPPVETVEKYTFNNNISRVDRIIPAAIGNFEYGNIPVFPDGIVLHVFGEKDRDTLKSSINTFLNPSSEVSAHFLIEQFDVVQMVSIYDRAYHAGPGGNNYWGIELSPHLDDETKKQARMLINELQHLAGKKLKLMRHFETGTVTQCGTTIDLSDFEVPYEDPNDSPVEEPKPTEPNEEEEPVDKTPQKEAAKNVGRNGILSALSVLIAVGADWALGAILGLNLPVELTVALGGLAYALFLYVDKFIHQRNKEGGNKTNGLIGF